MKAMDLISEGISPIVYHATNPANVIRILTSDKFLLRPSFTKPAENSIQGKQKSFFMSTTRTRTGKYHKHTDYALLQLDGSKIAQRHSASPVDYYGPSWRVAAGGDYEQEDRIVSYAPEILNAKSYIMGIDLTLTYPGVLTPHTYKVYYLAKVNGIPVRIFTSSRERDIQSNPLSHREIMALASDVKMPKTYQRSRRPHQDDHTLAIRDALYFSPQNKMPKMVENRIKKLMRYWYGIDRGSVSTDLHNASSADNMRNVLYDISRKMRKLNLKDMNSVRNFINYKWGDWS